MTDTERVGRALGTILRVCQQTQFQIGLVARRDGTVGIDLWSRNRRERVVVAKSLNADDIANALEELEARMIGVADA